MTYRSAEHRGRDETSGRTWALVLAAGEGSRLQTLTTTRSGTVIPKQFCSLYNGPSLLHEAMKRGLSVASPTHLCAVVAARHRRWWEGPLWSLPASNIIVQPENRGTANGILLPLLHIAVHDPDANIVLLPSDHHVNDEPTLAKALRDTTASLTHFSGDIVCLGIEPEEPDAELGYIVPQAQVEGGTYRVVRFVEKPSPAQARQLIDEGALWNAFIVAAKVRALLSLFEERIPEIVSEMRAVVHRDLDQPHEATAAIDLYSRLPTLDFSRHILQGEEHRLRVRPVPQCGWSDLGTPKGVGEALQRKGRLPTWRASSEHPISSYGLLSLAAQHWSRQGDVSP